MENVNDKIIIYQADDGNMQIDVRLENETVWMTQAQMAELFLTDRTSIVRHINNIYKAEELEREATCAKKTEGGRQGKVVVAKFAHTTQHGAIAGKSLCRFHFF